MYAERGFNQTFDLLNKRGQHSTAPQIHRLFWSHISTQIIKINFLSNFWEQITVLCVRRNTLLIQTQLNKFNIGKKNLLQVSSFPQKMSKPLPL